MVLEYLLLIDLLSLHSHQYWLRLFYIHLWAFLSLNFWNVLSLIFFPLLIIIGFIADFRWPIVELNPSVIAFSLLYCIIILLIWLWIYYLKAFINTHIFDNKVVLLSISFLSFIWNFKSVLHGRYFIVLLLHELVFIPFYFLFQLFGLLFLHIDGLILYQNTFASI